MRKDCVCATCVILSSSRDPDHRASWLRRGLLAMAVSVLLIPAAYGGESHEAASLEPEATARLLLPAHEVDGGSLDDGSSAPRDGEADPEPIAYIGHGAFFGQDGKQLVPTAEFVARAQNWYRERLLSRLTPEQEAEFSAFEHRLSSGITLDEQNQLVVKQRSLAWLSAHAPLSDDEGRMLGKLNALKSQLNWVLPRRDDLEELRNLEPFELDLMVSGRLKAQELELAPHVGQLATTNTGQDYIDECASYGVPIPPPIGVLDPAGLTGWRTLGFIPPADQFIVGTPAEVRVYESGGGMCIALPRYTNAGLGTVALDGVICLSQTTSKVCFWDNQNTTLGGFTFASGAQIPIGVPDLVIDPAGRYQGGGAELQDGIGGICADCHAGENPYIVHPNSNLGPNDFGDMNGVLGLPTFGPNRYDPIVKGSWYQNTLSHSQPLVPPVCGGCHTLGGSGGRFPHLSSDIPGYCGTILAQAITNTMPPGSPGSQAGTTAITDFQAFCATAPAAGPSNRGDPHITTTNGVKYDFQAGGEFVALRNSANGFELQTRQSPVLTTFTPGPNPYTGLSSCVSLNTAVAFRIGKHRISYQPEGREPQKMQLRVDGKPLTLNEQGFPLGGGNWLATAAAGGGIEVRVNDGTRVIVTPTYWSSQGYWYLNVEVLDTPAREGIMGPILGSSWLPRKPDGSSFGPMPGSLAARDVALNQAFANAWRVTSSLFDYAPGTSSESFQVPSWPPPSGTSCATVPGDTWPPGAPTRAVRGMDPHQAFELCQDIQDPDVFKDCVFDMTLMGDPGIVDAYLLTLLLRTL